MTQRISVSDLLPDTNYTLRMRAKNGASFSEWSLAVPFTTITDDVPPETPTGLSWTVIDDSFHAEWNTVTHNTDGDNITVSRYDVELVGGSSTKIITVPQSVNDKVTFDLSFENNKALFGTAQPTVTIRVRAVDNKELLGAYTSVISASNPVPSNPSSFVGTGGTGTIDFTWTPPADTDLVGYEISTSSVVVWTGLATRITYQTTNYTAQTFTLKAIDKFGQKSSGTSVTVTAASPFTVDTTPPGVPSGLAATITANANGIGATAAVSWSAVGDSDLAGYVVRYRRNATSDNWTEAVVSDDTTSTTVPLNFIYTSYDFQVRSFDFASNFSAWSSVVTASGGTNSAPGNVSTISSLPTWDSITYSWTGVSDTDLKNYEVTFSTSSTFASGNTTFMTGSSNTLTVSGLIPSTTYYARVRAVDTGGLNSSSWSSTNTTTTEFQGGTISSSGPITLGPSADIILNGGYIKSNTYTGVAQATNPSGAGFYLGNDGIRIDQGIISADAFVGGTITGGNIVIGAGGSISSTGFTLSNTGLTVTSGSISASALMIQAGINIVPPEWADFEANFDAYVPVAGTNATLAQTSTSPRTNGNALQVTRGASTAVFSAYLATSTTDYNIAVTPSTDYIVSAYVRNRSSVTTALRPQVKWSDGSFSVMSSYTTPTISSSTWQRVSYVVTSPSNVTGALILLDSTTTTSGAQFDIDAVQMEAKLGGSTTPGPWSPPGGTLINGSLIRTGSIQSTSLTGLGGSPLWSIPLNGSATFQNLQVRGTSIVGAAGDGSSSLIQSYNYLSTSAGWKIDAAGNAEFNGNITGSGTITGPIFQTASSGQRMVMRNDGTGGVIESYTGISGETSASINPTTTLGGTLPGLFVFSGTIPSRVNPAGFTLFPGSTDFGGAVSTNAKMSVSGDLVATKSLTVGQAFKVTGGPGFGDATFTGHATFTGTDWQVVGTAVSWATGWSQQAGGKQVRYKRIGDWVFIDGTADHGTTGTGLIFTLPAGYRPPSSTTCYKSVRYYTGLSNSGAGSISIDDTGAVTMEQLVNNSSTSFDMVMFDIST